MVGWRAAWWTGLLFGPPMVIITLRRCHSKSLPRIMGVAFLVAVVVDVICGLGTLAAASILVDDQSFRDVWIPHGVQHRAAFLRSGIMHDASYAGGLLATMVGCLAIVKMTRPSRLGIA